MAQQDNNNRTPNAEDADFAKAFQELSRGEQTATALENHLTALEAKIEEMLAQADREEAARSSGATSSKTPDSTHDAKQ